MPESSGRDPVSQIVLEELRALRTEINSRLDKLVSTEAFDAERRRVDDRHADLRNDIVEEREARMLDTADLRAAGAKTASLVRWTFASIVIPTAGLVAAIVMSMK